MSVFAILVLLMICALVLETSSIYVDKLRAQRAADIANLAAANTTTPIVNAVPSNTALATAKQMAVLNGFQASDVVTTVTPGGSELSTTIRHDSQLGLGRLLTASQTVAVDGTSSARVGSPDGDCVRSMFGPVNIYNNAVIDGPGCTIAASTYLYVCGKASVEALRAETGYPQAIEKAYICPGVLIDPPLSRFTFNKVSVDPLVADSRIVAIKNRLKGMTSWAYGATIPKSPLSPTVISGKNESYSSTTVTLPSSRPYGTLTISNATVAFTGTGVPDPKCLTPTSISGNILLSGVNRLTFGSGCYAIAGYVTNAVGAETRFDPLPGAQVTLAFTQYIDNKAATLTFGDMEFSLKGDVRNADGGTFTFGNGSFSFGAGIINGSGRLTFGDGAYYVAGGSITNGTGTLMFGDGKLYLWGGSLANSSTGTVTFGNGGFYFYGGTVTNAAGHMTFGDGPFEFSGGSLALNPGSDTVFGFGNMNFYGGTAYFHGKSTVVGQSATPSAGSGLPVDDDLTVDATRGSSSVFFYGGSFSMKSDRFVAVGTTLAFYGGSVSLYGVGPMNVTAPTGDAPVFGYKNILFYIYGGAFSLYQAQVTDILSGIIYVPGTNISIYGSQTVTIPDDGCFQVIGGVVDIYQNTWLSMRPCTGSGAADWKVSLTR